MTGAMYAAIGGLKTHMTNMNVIGNNIANVNTTAYKAQRMIFQESIYTTSRAGSDGTVTRGGNTPSQIGYGSEVGAIDLNMSPGTFSPTGVALDCMIEGDGFFMVGDKDMQFNDSTDYPKVKLTRAGDFNIDSQGWVVDRNNNVVYGFAMVANPNYVPNATSKTAVVNGNEVNIIDKYIVSTELVPLRVPQAAVAPTTTNGGINGDGSQNWQTGDPVYDLLGTATTEAGGRRNFSLAEHPEYFDPDTGELLYDQLPEGVGMPLGADGTTTGNLTDANYRGKGFAIPNTNDVLVSMEGISINTNGAITGVAGNGDTVVIGYVAIAQCTAPDGVTHVGGPYYKAQEGAGEVTVGIAGGLLPEGTYLNNEQVLDNGGDPITPGLKNALSQMKSNEIRNGGLEASTADVANEFAQMILTQRGYQANTRIVTVTDSMLEELVNMKR